MNKGDKHYIFNIIVTIPKQLLLFMKESEIKDLVLTPHTFKNHCGQVVTSCLSNVYIIGGEDRLANK